MTNSMGAFARIPAAVLALVYLFLCSFASAQGQIETYGYDAAGNVIRIQRVSNGAAPAIASFSPAYGQVGTQVVIDGSGFSTIATGNIVKFNGTQATVLTASTGQLLVAVPTGATTGAISVQVGSNIAQSSGPFTIGQASVPPQITGISPLSGSAGATVSIFGTHLLPQAGQTTATMNGVSVPLIYSSDAQLNFSVPAHVGSGFVSVTTPFGQATSSSIFQVDPPGITPSSVTWNAPLSLGSSSTAISLTSGQYAAFTFLGNANDSLSIQLSAFTSSNKALSYAVYDATSTSIASGTLYPALRRFICRACLHQAGTPCSSVRAREPIHSP